MARVNISIPDDLRERMEGLNVNWSSLAQAAFAHAIDVEQMRAYGQNMESGLERLRADRNRNSAHEEARGFKAGSSWALEEASYDELQSFVQDGNLRQDFEALARRVDVIEDGLSFALPDMPPRKAVTTPYAQGFLAGATDVFHKI